MSKQHPKYYDQDPDLGPVEELNAMVGLGGLAAERRASATVGGARGARQAPCVVETACRA